MKYDQVVILKQLNLNLMKKLVRDRDLKKEEIHVEVRGSGGGSRSVCALLRRKSIFELHAGDIVVERHRHDLLHGADQAVLLAAVLDHQRV